MCKKEPGKKEGSGAETVSQQSDEMLKDWKGRWRLQRTYIGISYLPFKKVF